MGGFFIQYEQWVSGTFLERPNRFIANVRIGGRTETVHVKNTGRCRELLVPGATVYLEVSDNPRRKTGYSLIAVQKGERLINMDSMAPNRAVEEALKGGLRLPGFPAAPGLVRREVTFGESRMDFLVSWADCAAFVEVKGVTLEDAGVVSFPDAPTERGIRHLETLSAAVGQGYGAHVLFVVQMEGASYFTPNNRTHPAFGQALRKARDSGVVLHAWDCKVTPGSMCLHRPVEIRL